MDKVTKDLVISMDYKLSVDGEQIDFSEENDPIVFIQGQGNIIPGLEKAIEGLKIGDAKDVFVKAADGYGEYDPEGFVSVPRAEFPAEIPLEKGTEITVNDDDGEEMAAYIEEYDNENVKLNFNHPLAGKDLNFSIKIVGIREATAEELEHGHVHFEDDDCCCGEDGEECCGGHDDCHCKEDEA